MDSNNIISSLGGGSGINTSSLVEGLIAAERIPKESQYDAKQEKLDLQLSSYGVMASAMSTLNESAAALGSSETFNTKNVSYTETTVLTPTAVDADALAGEYEVEVTALAKSHSLSSASYSDTGGQVGKGVLTFKFGAWDAGYTAFTLDGDKATQAITIDDSNNSLTGLRDAINDADFGVQASIVQEGSGYKLQVIGPSGASNELEITVVEDGSAGGEAGDVDATGLSLLAFNTAGSQLTANQAGADAALNVNGMAVTRESNKIDDVIQGLDFTLNKASVGEIVAFTITDDTVAAEQAVRDFVTAYNDFFNTMKDLTTATDAAEEGSTDGGLSSDPTARSIMQQVQSTLRQSVTGLSGNYTALSTVGVMTTLEGELEINEGRFTQAFTDDFDAVTDLFSPSTSSTDSRVEVAQYKSTTKAGSFPVVITTSPTKGSINGGTITATEFDPVAEDFTAGAATGLDTSGGGYTFKLAVDGTTSGTITLSDTYTTTEALRAELESLINTDTTLSGVGAKVDVGYDATNDRFTFTSRSWGSSAVVDVTEVGANMASLGITVANGTHGVDVAGTIDGETGFGSGNILLPPLGSDLAGMSLKIAPDVTSATVTYSRGFAGELSNLIDSFLADQGLIDQREDRINSQLEDVSQDRTELEDRMPRRTLALQAQFIAMERILASLGESEGLLDGLVNRLPFTYNSG